MINTLRKLLPKNLKNYYHGLVAILATVYYRFPSKKLIVVGVTGTNGKTTTSNMIAKVLEEGGYKVGMSTTANFKIGDREWINATKQTMQGRFGLQKMLRQMVEEKCDYAVIETSSEGVAQYRHLGVDYDIVVLTNLTPEHIESHGSFEKYKEAKGKLFKKLLTVGYKTDKKGNKVNKISVVNLDSEHAKYFLDFHAEKKYGFGKFVSKNVKTKYSMINDFFLFGQEQISSQGTKFIYKNQEFQLKLLGLFNIYNAAAAACVGMSQGIDTKTIKKGLEKIEVMPGRMELINEGQDFVVIVDYAHEPAALESVYKSIKTLSEGKIISILGSCGGGRDKARRPKLGKLSAEYADLVYVTNEDPYDEDPETIINSVAEGAIIGGKKINVDLFKISDRREAINTAIKKAQAGDVIVITGKGSEQCIMSKNGEKIPWDDREEVRSSLKKIV